MARKKKKQLKETDEEYDYEDEEYEGRDTSEMLLEDLYILSLTEEEKDDNSGRWLLHDDNELELVGIDREVTRKLDKIVKKGTVNIKVNKLKKPSKERIKELFHGDGFRSLLSAPRKLLKKRKD